MLCYVCTYMLCYVVCILFLMNTLEIILSNAGELGTLMLILLIVFKYFQN